MGDRVWSGNRQRFRLNRGGNRQLTAALYRIAITQLRWSARGKAYFEHRLAAGATKREHSVGRNCRRLT
ncbi:MAG: IS110 family transposase [Candidatus Dormibacteraeota bacterium]|nr:IS110 family transposase [Candidatus Dormibacteraeota bacterium]